jgi:hypothetical protein
LPAKLGCLLTWKLFRSKVDLHAVSKVEDLDHSRDIATTGWYHWGIDPACDAIAREGFRVVERDMEVVYHEIL